MEEACARARNRWQNNVFLINVFIWFLSNPEYFICFTNIKFILEHLFINLSVLKIYYFCPILKKIKVIMCKLWKSKMASIHNLYLQKAHTTMDYLLATYTNSTGLGTLVTLASTYVPSKVAYTYTYDASQLRKFNHLHKQQHSLIVEESPDQTSHCSCMQI